MTSQRYRPATGFALVVSGTILSMAGTDLVLPAVPSLPELIGGTKAEAQLVLAAFVAGTGLGLLVFGELGARFDPRKILIGSMAAYGLLSLAAAFAPSLGLLTALRLLQGMAGSAPAVFAPGFIRALFSEDRAVPAIGLLGSIESLTPALAPVLGVYLLAHFGWQASFLLTGALAILLALALLIPPPRLPKIAAETSGSYLALLRRPIFLRYALSQAFCLGGLVVVVFAAPAVFTGPWGGTLAHFIALQVTGVAAFILAANTTGLLVRRFSSETLIVTGTLVSVTGILAILVYAAFGGKDPWLVIPPWLLVNIGFGLRGPPGFLRAIIVTEGDDARGSALVVLFILMTIAIGTAAAAPMVASGLTGVAGVASVISAAAALSLLIGR